MSAHETLNTFSELLGLKGAALLAMSGIPQAVKSIRDGKTGDISQVLLWMWGIGALDMLIFTLCTAPKTYPLLVNFGSNTIIAGIILWYYYFPRKSPMAWPLRRRRSNRTRASYLRGSRPK